MTYRNGPEVLLPSLRARPRARFLDVATEVKVTSDGVDRTLFGAIYLGMSPLSPILMDTSCDSEDTKTGNLNEGSTIETQSAFLFVNLLECSTLSGELDRLAEYTTEAFEMTVSEALAIAATSAISGDHLNLADDSDVLPSGTSIAETIAIVEGGLAERISNAQGVIFISPRYLALADAARVIHREGDQLVTAAGHVIISDAGHQSVGTVYGTGVLGYSITNPLDLGGPDEMDFTRNVVTWLRERVALILFNPAHSVRSALLGAVS